MDQPGMKMVAAAAPAPGAPLRLVELPVPGIGPGEILIRVKACGVCHSDLHIVDGDWSSEGFPKIPGHEVAGTVEWTGPGVQGIAEGDHVGLPWIYSTCGRCEWCRNGDEPLCAERKITGLTVQGGFSQFIKAPASSVTKIPKNLSFTAAAPLFCAGLTSYSAMKLAGVSQGDRVAVHGIGGLGHIAIQVAKQFGATVIALTGSESKARRCHELGADECFVGKSEDAARALDQRGGCDVIFSTAPEPSSLSPLISALRGNGRLVIVGAGPGEMTVKPRNLISKRLRIMGSPVGTKRDMEEVLVWASQGKITVKAVERPLSEVNEALNDLRKGSVDFRQVLIP